MFMVGETSGDTLAVELLEAMRQAGQTVEPFGAGGPKMKSSGVELKIDLTEHAVIGIWEAIRNYGKFKGFFDQLLQLALDRKPDAVICIDNPGFNLRFVRALRKATAGGLATKDYLLHQPATLGLARESRASNRCGRRSVTGDLSV